MADIFISYAREDQGRAKVLEKALEDHGWSVWWDPEIPPGKSFDQVIEEAIEQAKCILVLWSKESIGSDWVKEEAEVARQRKILVPVLIDKVNPPIGFKRVQAADLTDWHGEPAHAGFTRLVAAISQMIVPPVTEAHAGAQAELSESETTTIKSTEQATERESSSSVPEQDVISSLKSPTGSEPDFSPLSVTVPASTRGKKSVIGIGVAALILITIGVFWFFPLKKGTEPKVVPSQSFEPPITSNSRIFLLTGKKTKESLFAPFRKELEAAGFRVLGEKTIQDEGRPVAEEVRYFYKEDQAQAKKIAEGVKRELSIPELQVKLYSDPKARPGYIEIWFGK